MMVDIGSGVGSGHMITVGDWFVEGRGNLEEYIAHALARSVISPAPTSRPSIFAADESNGAILLQEVEKETAAPKLKGFKEMRGKSKHAEPASAVGEAFNRLLAGEGGAQHADKGVWGRPVSLWELAFDMELEPAFETELEQACYF
jgi:hypothetical protein